MKSQFFPNRIVWRLGLATGLSHEFKLSAKSFFVCMRNEISWNIELNKTNSSLKTLNNNVTKIVLKHWTKGNKESLLLNLFLRGLKVFQFSSWSVPHGRNSWSLKWGLCFLYIYIYWYWYIYIYIYWWAEMSYQIEDSDWPEFVLVNFQNQT